MIRKILFVSGAARSGTSAMVQVLNSQDGFLIGMERYNRIYRAGAITPAHFDKARFLDRQDGDTHDKGGFGNARRDDLNDRFDRARVIGDKFPQLFLFFPQIFASFPDARHVFMLRDPLAVAESYQRRKDNPEDPWQRGYRVAVRDWNRSLKAVLDLSKTQRENVFVAEYERIFSKAEDMRRLFGFLGEPLDEARLAPFLERAENLTQARTPPRDDIRLYVEQHANWNRQARLKRLI